MYRNSHCLQTVSLFAITGSKNIASASRVSTSSKGGNVKQQNHANEMEGGGGGVVWGDLGVPQAVVGSTNSVSSKGSHKDTEPPANKVGSTTTYTSECDKIRTNIKT